MQESTGPHDAVVLRLQELREGVGAPSYAEIARAVAALRETRGLSPDAARLARSTVYDAFRQGRQRLDLELVNDIVTVLEARRAVWVDVATTLLEDGTEPEPAAPAAAAAAVPAADPDPPRGDDPSSGQPSSGETSFGQPSWRGRAAVVVLCVAVNLVGLVLVDGLDIPIWLDMIGTAVAAIALGPWWGAGVGLVSTGLDGALTGSIGFWFAPVQVAGALVWGIGARRFRMAATSLRFFGLNVLVALASTAVAAPIVALKFNGYTEHDSDALTMTLDQHVPWFWLAILTSNIVFSVIDKLVSGFVALAVLEALASRWHSVRALLALPGAGARPDEVQREVRGEEDPARNLARHHVS